MRFTERSVEMCQLQRERKRFKHHLVMTSYYIDLLHIVPTDCILLLNILRRIVHYFSEEMVQFVFVNALMFLLSVCQKKGTKRRLKSKGIGSMGVASERAVSIPQITYDHIDDSEEKKDVSFFLEEPRGTAEGRVLPKRPIFSYCQKATITNS